MRAAILHRSVRTWFFVGTAVLMAVAFRSLPAQAGLDTPSGHTEVRLPQAVIIYALPDPTSAVVANLPPFSVVDGIRHQIGTDGVLWEQVQLQTQAGLLEGWMHMTDFLTGSPTDFNLLVP